MRGSNAKKVKVNLYVEGGGETADTQKPLRDAFHQFLDPHLPRSPGILCCGGRSNTLRDFRNGVRDKRDEVHILLLDSERPVASSTRDHLVAEFGAADVPAIGDDHFQLMTPVMETWIPADPSSITKAFPRDADIAQIPAWPDIEAVPKQTIYDTLVKASGGRYAQDDKRLPAAKILKHADATTVRSKPTPHCERLLTVLNTLLS